METRPQTTSPPAEEPESWSAQRLFALLPVTTGFVASVAVALVVGVPRQGPVFPTDTQVVACAGAAVGLALLAAVALGRRSRRFPPAAKPWALALHLSVLACVIPACLLVMAPPADRLTGWVLPVTNKRWLIALYNLAIVTVLVLPLAFARWLELPLAADSAAMPRPASRKRWRWVWLALGQALILGLCWYLAGPPWHLKHYDRWLDWHEQMRLGGLQAISKGYLPFVGPAAFPHGPGTQLIVYAVMKATRHFDLVGFRTGWATLHLLGFLIIASAAYWFTGFVRALFVVLLAIMFSPLAVFYTLPDGTFTGFYGWANALRYVAPLVVAPAVARLAPQESRALSVAVLGAFWAVGAWLAQESLTTTAVATGLVLVLLYLTKTVSAGRALRVAAWLVVGFACAVAPILGYYAWHGAAGEFVHNYFFMAHAVMSGVGSKWWSPEEMTAARIAYYWTAPLLLALAFGALWRTSPLEPVGPLGERRAQLLAFLCVQLACFQSVLLRSDSPHVLNTLIALPFILVLGFMEVAAWQNGRRGAQFLAGAAFVAIALVAYPQVRSYLPLRWTALLTQPAAKLTASGGEKRPAPYEGRVAYKRVPRVLHDLPELGNAAGVSMRTFLDLATDVHDIVGSRKTYVRDLGRDYFADGLLYFLADLTPAPAWPDRDTWTINDEVRQAVAERIRSRPWEFECFIASSLKGPEAAAFLETHPDAQRLERPLGVPTLYILLSPPGPGTRHSTGPLPPGTE